MAGRMGVAPMAPTLSDFATAVLERAPATATRRWTSPGAAHSGNEHRVPALRAEDETEKVRMPGNRVGARIDWE